MTGEEPDYVDWTTSETSGDTISSFVCMVTWLVLLFFVIRFLLIAFFIIDCEIDGVRAPMKTLFFQD